MQSDKGVFIIRYQLRLTLGDMAQLIIALQMYSFSITAGSLDVLLLWILLSDHTLFATFQAGIRRFVAAPIYSTPSNPREKAKFESFFPASESSTVATVYAPVMYSPVNVLQFRIRVTEVFYWYIFV